MLRSIRTGMGSALAFGIICGIAAAQDTGTLKGTIFLSHKAGEPPKITNLYNDIKTEPKCAEQYEKPQIRSEQIVAMKMEPAKEDQRWLQNVIIYVSSDVGPASAPPAEAKVLDQKGCLYIPHVVTLQVDQTLEVLNSDPILHNINAQPEKNPAFNYGQPQKGMKNPVAFKKPEIFKVKCDVHKWMGAWIGVFPHAFHAVSNEKGEFEIKGLPPGEHEITFWHEVFGEQKQKVTIKAGENKLDHTFKMEGSG
ncbi:MAG: hypothetical protein KJ057_04770 [Phycisphaerae bacterium]|nr:MAG: hypothetical protein EDS66_12575 [Planctomycetota bacterium]KAB2939264.1 MAG: hypothetical protein F9K17_15300 [Phycisphaerae bacterium]MBE7455244.1 hypothetical protein [Planctomycetia bacterium]MCK6464057.1 hypothetical protein [Phycisphaerae bacterium]MCL4717770.1 hypothetical protein [Phycisphaerae bacterium]